MVMSPMGPTKNTLTGMHAINIRVWDVNESDVVVSVELDVEVLLAASSGVGGDEN